MRPTIDNVSLIATTVTESLALSGVKSKAEVIPPSQHNISLVAACYQNGDCRLYNYPCTSQFVSLYLELISRILLCIYMKHIGWLC